MNTGIKKELDKLAVAITLHRAWCAHSFFLSPYFIITPIV